MSDELHDELKKHRPKVKIGADPVDFEDAPAPQVIQLGPEPPAGGAAVPASSDAQVRGLEETIQPGEAISRKAARPHHRLRLHR